jgi:hypothetical protein
VGFIVYFVIRSLLFFKKRRARRRLSPFALRFAEPFQAPFSIRFLMMFLHRSSHATAWSIS